MGKRRERQKLNRREHIARSRTAGTVRPGRISPTRSVPAHIPRPPYIPDAAPIDVPDSELIERMREAGQVAREVLLETAKHIRAGVTTDELDAVAHQACIDRDAYPSPLGYKDFPKSICTSVNEVICHGIPDDRLISDGEIINCDVTVFLNGVHGDHSETFLVGDANLEARKLVEVTRECMWRGIGIVKPGARVRDIGRAIQQHAENNGFGVVRVFVGHGIGTEFHTQPTIFHYEEPSAKLELEEGMTFTIEPMITVGSFEVDMWEDGWTAVTQDRSLSAQFEHTMVVTETGVEVLTLLPDEPRPIS